MKKIFILALSAIAIHSYAQTDSLSSPFVISGYVESYYSHDLSNPEDHNRPSFIYSHNRHNEVNLNLGLIKAAYAKDDVRGNLGIMTGTYANANLAAEAGVLKNIFEANAGLKLSKKKSLWLDAGIFASHIGFESAIGKDCWNVTRSILADNSPYYESGVKVSYTSDNEKWQFTGLILNGWQRIQRLNGNNTPSLGHQITYKPNSKILFNSSSFVGSDTPDSTRLMRYFHNFYTQILFSDRLGMIFGFDVGVQQKMKNSTDYNLWYSPVLIMKYNLSDRLSLAARGEYYNDTHGVIISTGTTNGFQTFGYSFNVDYQIKENAVWRIEARSFNSKDDIFILDNAPSSQNYFFTTALAISF